MAGKNKARNVPTPGLAVKLRGREVVGVLEWVNSLNWCKVKWDTSGPNLCHLFEIEAL